MRPRFYLPELDDSARGVLDDDESGHLTRVLRLGVGAEIDVFDGRGTMRHARVAAIARRRVVVEALQRTASASEPVLRVTLAIGVLKGDKMDHVIRDAAMMGVAAIQPLVTARSETSRAVLTRSQRVDRWRRVAVGGVKQSGRAVVPAVAAPLSLTEWMQGEHDAPLLTLVEPAAGGGAALRDVPSAPAVRLLVGPEGGWSDDELASMSLANAARVALGRRTLRADAVPLVAMAALFEAWNGW